MHRSAPVRRERSTGLRSRRSRLPFRSSGQSPFARRPTPTAPRARPSKSTTPSPVASPGTRSSPDTLRRITTASPRPLGGRLMTTATSLRTVAVEVGDRRVAGRVAGAVAVLREQRAVADAREHGHVVRRVAREQRRPARRRQSGRPRPRRSRPGTRLRARWGRSGSWGTEAAVAVAEHHRDLGHAERRLRPLVGEVELAVAVDVVHDERVAVVGGGNADPRR